MEVAQSARRKPYTAKTMNLCPLPAAGLRCIEQSLETKRSGGPSAKQDLETIRFGVFAAPGLHRPRSSGSTSSAESGMSPASFEQGLSLDRQRSGTITETVSQRTTGFLTRLSVTNGKSSASQASIPPSSGRTLVIPLARSSSATRALVASLGHEQ